MLISELTVYDFLKDKIKLSDSDAKRYAKEMSLSEEKLRNEVRADINDEIKKGDYATRKDIKELEIRIEKGFKEVIIWVLGFMIGITGIALAIIKLF
jgi:rRNA maturation endonuclease Nob1